MHTSAYDVKFSEDIEAELGPACSKDEESFEISSKLTDGNLPVNFISST